jgi:hypothetical protein
MMMRTEAPSTEQVKDSLRMIRDRRTVQIIVKQGMNELRIRVPYSNALVVKNAAMPARNIPT